MGSPPMRDLPVSRYGAHFADHLQWCVRSQDRPELQQHPVVGALLALYVSKFRVYMALPSHAHFVGAPIALKLMADLEELGGWVFKRGHRQWSEQQNDQVTGLFRNMGFNETRAKELRDTIAARSGGRPPSRRRVAIEAMELKLKNPSLSWGKVAREVCDCGRAHDECCEANLMTRLKELRKLLRKHEHPLGRVKPTDSA